MNSGPLPERIRKNVSQIYDKVMADISTLKPVELRVYGASMGGTISKRFLDRYRQAGAPYEEITL
jgi:surfactin synthase thioesterase subunit